MGGYERDPAPWSPRRRPGRLQRPAAGPGHGRASSRSWRAPSAASRRSRTPASAGSSTAPRRSRRTTSSSSARPRSAASWSRRGSARTASPGAGGIGRQMAELDRRRRARARPLEDGHPPVRRGIPLAALHARPDDRELRDLLRHPLPERGAARPAGPLRTSPGVRAARGARRGRSARSRGGSARTGSKPNARGRPTRRSGRAAGRAGTGRRRSGPRRSRRGRPPALFDESSFAKLEVSGPGARAFLAADVRERHRRRGRLDRLHAAARPPRRDPGRPHRHPPRRRIDSCSSPARPSGTTISAWLRQHLPEDGSVALRDVTSARVCFGLWGPRARDIVGSVTRRRPLERGVPVPDRARDHRRVRAGDSRCGSRTSASSGGSCTPRPSTAARCGRRSGTPGGRTGWSPAGTARSTRCGSRRATASGRATSPPTRRRTRRGSGSPSRSTRASIPRSRGAGRGEGGRPAQAAALSRARRPAVGLPRQRARPGRAARSSVG